VVITGEHVDNKNLILMFSYKYRISIKFSEVNIWRLAKIWQLAKFKFGESSTLRRDSEAQSSN